jgi:hypothetical protein
MKDNHYDVKEVDARRGSARRKKKKGKKVALIIIAFIVIAAASFVLTIKLVDPSFDFKALMPASVSESVAKAEDFIYGKLLGKPQNENGVTVVTKQTTTETTTAETTTRASGRYAPIEQFALDEDLKGNYLGNVLLGGQTASDNSYFYHSVDGKGIYRFNPSNEDYTKIYSSADKLRCLNVRGDFLYFINANNNKLYKVSKGQQSAVTVAKDAKFAYVYDSDIYIITTDNRLITCTVSNFEKKTLYNANDNDISFIGLSKKRVYFSVTNFLGDTEYLCVQRTGKKSIKEFLDKTGKDELLYPVMENGFMYYYKANGDKFDLMRRKFGSEKPVKLVKKAESAGYTIPAGNRLYFAELKNGRFSEKELNMNSDNIKEMLFVRKTKADNTLTFQHNGSYDFIIGRKEQGGKKVYIASSMYTGSTNVMSFADGKWKY